VTVNDRRFLFLPLTHHFVPQRCASRSCANSRSARAFPISWSTIGRCGSAICTEPALPRARLLRFRQAELPAGAADRGAHDVVVGRRPGRNPHRGPQRRNVRPPTLGVRVDRRISLRSARDFGVMDESIDERYDASGAWEDLLPLGKRLVGGNDGALLFVASVEQFEEQVRVAIGVREVSDFIDDEYVWCEVIAIEGKSYRLKKAEERSDRNQQRRRRTPKAPK
jgi:hypothetical protein